MPEPSPRILLVDDNARLVENLSEILGDAGYTVDIANSCAQGRAKAATGFEVALVDLQLPDGNGTTLAGELKELCPEGEVVLMTGFATVETAAAAVRAGAFAYLLKPSPTPELLLTLEQALRHVRLGAEKRGLARRAQIAEKLAAVGTMTAGLSHEIRNPLNAAGLQLQVLERRVEKLPDSATRTSLLEPLRLVRDEIRRLDHVLEDFLQFARPRELLARPVELVPLINRVLDLLQNDAERRSIRVVRQLADMPVISGDDGRLRQVVMNLALNAMEAMNGPGQLTVSTEQQDRMVAITLEDTGPGIPPELRERIFEPFFTTKATGSGLGLPIVHAIITQHGGTIEIKNGQERGTRFVVRLPIAKGVADA
ncbi:MAG: response regulator [Myxococcaceae bacterium]|nr:response regulator [Myxococcaceae bacterium]